MVQSIYIFDHHASAIDKLNSTNLPENIYNFSDINESGGSLVCKAFYGESLPKFVELSRDYDHGRFEVKDIHEFYHAMMFLGDDFKAWGKYVFEEKLTKINEIGSILYQAHQKRLKEYLDLPVRTIKFNGYVVPFMNIPRPYVNDYGTILSTDYAFVIMYTDYHDGRTYNLRSSRSRPDINVGKLAELYGGQGHPTAASFTLPYPMVRHHDV